MIDAGQRLLDRGGGAARAPGGRPSPPAARARGRRRSCRRSPRRRCSWRPPPRSRCSASSRRSAAAVERPAGEQELGAGRGGRPGRPDRRCAPGSGAAARRGRRASSCRPTARKTRRGVGPSAAAAAAHVARRAASGRRAPPPRAGARARRAGRPSAARRALGVGGDAPGEGVGRVDQDVDPRRLEVARRGPRPRRSRRCAARPAAAPARRCGRRATRSRRRPGRAASRSASARASPVPPRIRRCAMQPSRVAAAAGLKRKVAGGRRHRRGRRGRARRGGAGAGARAPRWSSAGGAISRSPPALIRGEARRLAVAVRRRGCRRCWRCAGGRSACSPRATRSCTGSARRWRGTWRPARWRCCPGPSAFGLAAARLGWALQEVETVSLHGAAGRAGAPAAASRAGASWR